MISKKRMEIASMIGISEKSYRLTERFSWAIQDIESKISPETYKLFNKAFYEICTDKKKCLSRNQIIAIAQYNGETITNFINEFAVNPKQAKEVYKKYFHNQDYSVKITCEISGKVNDILTDKAKERGMSKTQYISGILTLLSLGEIE